MALDYLEERYYRTEVFHDMVNKILELVALNKNSHIAHEWYFINVLISEIERKPDLAEKFAMYVFQVCPDYKWIDYKASDPTGSVVLECAMHQFQFKMKCDLDEYDDRFIDLENAMLFGELVTDFLIRYCGYSLIKSSGQKIIITSQNDCHKRFEEQLYDGYCIQKRCKIKYNSFEELNISNRLFPWLKGFYDIIPAMPTRELDIDFDEMIEMKNGNYQFVRKSR